MKISMAVSTNRPHYWQRFCDHLAHNDVDLEVIFVGPASERPRLPVPAKFIKSDANPALCWEIGARAASGDLLGFSCDDFCYTEGFLNDVVALASLNRRPYDMFSARYVHNGVEQIAGQMMLSVRAMPVLPVGGLAYTEDHHRLGGIDRRFHATLWDTDLYTRFYAAGGRTALLCGHWCHEQGRDSVMFVNHSAADRVILESLWFRGGVAGFSRTSDPQPYDEASAGVRVR